MKTFTMNSLLGADNDEEDIISDNDTWVELDINTYTEFYNEVKEDGCSHLFELFRISGQSKFDISAVKAHFMEYDVPVLILEDQNAIDSYFAAEVLDTPGLVKSEETKLNDVAACLRCRLSSKRSGLVCLFPFILMPHTPPIDLTGSPLLAHEMLHLRKTFTGLYNERAIKYTYWNKDLQALAKANLHSILEHKITTLLTDEFEALQANNDMESVNLAMSQSYIPMALNNCANILDWWLNDEQQYLNISRTSRFIAECLFTCLTDLGYADMHPSQEMTPLKWRGVTELVFREAYKFWQKRPDNFVELLKRSLET